MDNELGGLPGKPPGKSAGLEPDVRWLSYAEIAKIRGISRASVERKVRRARWRRQIDNQGVTRVAVPLAYAESAADDPADNPGGGPAGSPSDSQDGVARLEQMVTEANKRADAVLALADRLTAQLADATERIEQAENRADAAHQRAGRAEARADASEKVAQQAREAATAAEERAAGLRQADDARKARGRLRRAWDGWRGR
jgi:hypothetical protein